MCCLTVQEALARETGIKESQGHTVSEPVEESLLAPLLASDALGCSQLVAVSLQSVPWLSYRIRIPEVQLEKG